MAGTVTQVVAQNWLELKETLKSHPGGYSLHKSEEDLSAYIAAYWATMPEETPPDHSRPEGVPFPINVDVETLREIQESEYGIHVVSLPDGAMPEEAVRAS